MQYVCTPNSLEQNIILQQRPPAPESYGLNPDTTRLQMWTEWFNGPPVAGQSGPIRLRAATNGLSAVTANDMALDFGTMKIVRGVAFSLNGTSGPVPVAKEWHQTQGRNFLVETVDYRAIEPSLQTLTATADASPKKTFASREQLIQTLTASVAQPAASRAMQVARAETGPAKGVVLDFTIIDAIPLPAGAIEWWPAGGDANDVVGGNNGTMMNGATFAAGEVGQGFSVDGVSSYVKIPTSTDPAGPFTIEFWMQADPNNAMDNIQGLVAGDFYGIEISSGWGGNNGVNFYISPDGGSTWNMTSTPNDGGAVVSSGDWHHVAATYDGTNMQLYVDGQAWGDWYPSAPPVPTTTGSFLAFGSEDGRSCGCGSRDFNGILDEVTIYNRALAPSEIAAIYNAGGAGKDNPNCVAPSSNTIGWWAGDGTADDLVSTNNGTLQGGATYSSGEVAQAFDLDGNSGYVQVPDNDSWAFGNNDFTIEFWVNFLDLPEYDSLYYPDAIFVANDEGPYDVNKWIFDLGDGVLTLLVDGPANGLYFIGQAPFSPDMNTWYHLALTREGTNINIYVNGVPAGTDTLNTPIPNANGPLTIGQAEGLGYVNGQIDEMTIYNRALSGSEISAIYSSGGAGKCKTDLDFDGLPDWWELYWFGTLSHTGQDPDGSGQHTLLDDYNSHTDPNVIQFTIESTNDYVHTATANVQVNITGGIPYYYAVFTNSTTTTNWLPFTTTNLTVSLGPTDGVYTVYVGLRGLPANATQTWQSETLTKDTAPPLLVVTNPVSTNVNVPLIQLQGYATEALSGLTFDVSNALGVLTGQQAFVTDQCYDTNLWKFTTNYFQCFDVDLTNGPNIITLHATDLAGNVTASNFSFTLDYSGATNPVIKLFWPQNGEQISGPNFTWRGWVDDPTATVIASIVDTNGNTSVVQGVVERNGNFWVDNLPMPNGTNSLTLAVTNAAGYSSTTNLTVSTNPLTVTMTPVPDDQLWNPTVTATGRISDSTYSLWINGVKAGVTNGVWTANNVPMTPGGVAIFNVTTYAPGETQPDNSHGN